MSLSAHSNTTISEDAEDPLAEQVFTSLHELNHSISELTQHLEHQFSNDSEDNNDDEIKDELPLSIGATMGSDRDPVETETYSNAEDSITDTNRQESDAGTTSTLFGSSRNLTVSGNGDEVESVDSEEMSLNRDDVVADEWDNDDDTGYVTITLSEPEFFEFEDRNTMRLFSERDAVKDSIKKQTRTPPLPPADSEAEEQDILASIEEDITSVVEQRQSKQPSLVEAGFISPGGAKTAKPFSEQESGVDSQSESVPNSPPFQDIGATPFPPLPPFENKDVVTSNPVENSVRQPRRQSLGEQRRSEIIGQHRLRGADGSSHCFFNLKVVIEPFKTGFEESKDFKHPKGAIIAGRYEVHDVLGSAAFSTALQCLDLIAEEDEAQYVCLKVIKNNKDFFDQSLDEIKLLQYINSRGNPDENHVLRLIDFFYCKEHLFIVSELLKENLYEFGRFIRENLLEVYYTLPRLKRIAKQILEALSFIHSLRLIHCDVKPENIVIKSFSRCEIKLIDFGSSCFTSDHLTTYIQSRSYRAPEVIIGHPYDSRIDVWSVGAVMAELYTGYVLFQNDSVQTMLSRITGILGPFPDHVLQAGRDTSKYFSLSNIVYERDESGSYQLIFPKKTTLDSRLHMEFSTPETRRLPRTEDELLFIDFIRTCLLLDPKKRVTTEEALQHPWLADAETIEIEQYIIGQPAAPAYEDRDVDTEDIYEDEEEDEDEDGENENYGYGARRLEDEDDEEDEGEEEGEYDGGDDEEEFMEDVYNESPEHDAEGEDNSDGAEYEDAAED